MKIYPYSQGSKSAKALAEALGCKRLKKQGRPHHAKDTVINWGCSAENFERDIYADVFLNWPESVSLAANKLKTFKAFKEFPGGVPAPRWTESRVEASRWLAEGVCKTVVCRTKLTGHSGEGIVLADKVEDVVEAPLYTAYVAKDQEYRIHVNQGVVFHVQRKARNKAVPDAEVNWKIRNHGNGFIFAHIGVDVPENTKQAAICAVMALGLDFGAVDIIQGKDGNWYVLEVNTACGLEGTTLEKYVEQFKQYV
jgi:glutathione synthase/RimK-type ligase-like ATP-grasp enzyme